MKAEVVKNAVRRTAELLLDAMKSKSPPLTKFQMADRIRSELGCAPAEAVAIVEFVAEEMVVMHRMFRPLDELIAMCDAFIVAWANENGL